MMVLRHASRPDDDFMRAGDGAGARAAADMDQTSCGRLHALLRLSPDVGLGYVRQQQLDLDPLRKRLPAQLERAVLRRQDDYLMGRAAAAMALSCAGNPHSAWLAMDHRRLPIWPAGWIGSISHANQAAIAIATAYRGARSLGVDMEPLIDNPAAIQHLVASDTELERLSALGPRWSLTLVFCAKEALYKALYPRARRIMEFSAARVVSADDHLVLRLEQNWGEGLDAGTRILVRFTRLDETVFTAVDTGESGG